MGKTGRLETEQNETQKTLAQKCKTMNLKLKLPDICYRKYLFYFL